MKAKLVKEELNKFEKNKDPMKSLDIGKDSTYLKEKTLEKLQNQGIRFTRLDDSETKERTLNNIFKIEKFINKLNKLDIEIKSVFGKSIYVKCYNLIDSNRVILQCMSKKDANYLIEVIKKLVLQNNYDLTISDDDEKRLDINDITNNWLDEIEENRKKYNIV